jgi:hypothetical protein
MNEEEKNLQNGALIDNRSEVEKAKDFKFEEIVTSVAPVEWKEKISTSWRKFPIFNQDSSGSCVAQTMAKLMGVLYYLKNNVYVHFSATHIYQRRSNKPAGGMSGTEAFDIARKGVTLEVLTPSQDMNDTQMDGIKIEAYKEEVGKIFALGNYIVGPVKDIETIASIIQETGKAIMVWYYFTYAEWQDVPEVKNENLDLYAAGTVRHSVTAVDFTLYKGKKCLIIEDSWGPNYGKGGQRIITEDFHKARNWFVAHPMNFKFDIPVVPPAPTFKFTLTLRQGDKNNEVTELQKYLQKAGFYPTNSAITGFFGSVTKASVVSFQKAKGLSADGIVGPKTREILNKPV